MIPLFFLLRVSWLNKVPFFTFTKENTKNRFFIQLIEALHESNYAYEDGNFNKVNTIYSILVRNSLFLAFVATSKIEGFFHDVPTVGENQ